MVEENQNRRSSQMQGRVARVGCWARVLGRGGGFSCLMLPQLFGGNLCMRDMSFFVSAERRGFMDKTPKPPPGKEYDRGGGIALQRAIIEWDNYIFDTGVSMLQNVYYSAKDVAVGALMPGSSANQDDEAAGAATSKLARKHPEKRKKWAAVTRVGNTDGDDSKSNPADMIPQDAEFLNEEGTTNEAGRDSKPRNSDDSTSSLQRHLHSASSSALEKKSKEFLAEEQQGANDARVRDNADSAGQNNAGKNDEPESKDHDYDSSWAGKVSSFFQAASDAVIGSFFQVGTAKTTAESSGDKNLHQSKERDQQLLPQQSFLEETLPPTNNIGVISTPAPQFSPIGSPLLVPAGEGTTPWEPASPETASGGFLEQVSSVLQAGTDAVGSLFQRTSAVVGLSPGDHQHAQVEQEAELSVKTTSTTETSPHPPAPRAEGCPSDDQTVASSQNEAVLTTATTETSPHPPAPPAGSFTELRKDRAKPSLDPSKNENANADQELRTYKRHMGAAIEKVKGMDRARRKLQRKLEYPELREFVQLRESRANKEQEAERANKAGSETSGERGPSDHAEPAAAGNANLTRLQVEMCKLGPSVAGLVPIEHFFVTFYKENSPVDVGAQAAKGHTRIVVAEYEGSGLDIATLDQLDHEQADSSISIYQGKRRKYSSINNPGFFGIETWTDDLDAYKEKPEEKKKKAKSLICLGMVPDSTPQAALIQRQGLGDEIPYDVGTSGPKQNEFRLYSFDDPVEIKDLVGLVGQTMGYGWNEDYSLKGSQLSTLCKCDCESFFSATVQHICADTSPVKHGTKYRSARSCGTCGKGRH
ncbi:unnamed protein product [Amoebophrya sp. A120]|nr:unnamed protein product [Amoebophrya sp. A120]|eukprot:GSA120T00022155001.1